jgi:hypothetical protein
MSRRPGRLENFRRPLWNEIARWVVNLPRLVRILLAAVFALSATLAVFPLVDYLYLSYMFTPDTRLLPSLVSAGAGVVMYLVGWWLIVGSVGTVQPSRPAVFWYVCAGVLLMLLVIVLSAFGLFSAADAMVV